MATMKYRCLLTIVVTVVIAGFAIYDFTPSLKHDKTPESDLVSLIVGDYSAAATEIVDPTTFPNKPQVLLEHFHTGQSLTYSVHDEQSLGDKHLIFNHSLDYAVESVKWNGADSLATLGQSEVQKTIPKTICSSNGTVTDTSTHAILEPAVFSDQPVKAGQSWTVQNVYPGITEHAHLAGYSVRWGEHVAVIFATFDGPDAAFTQTLTPTSSLTIFDLDRGLIAERITGLRSSDPKAPFEQQVVKLVQSSW